MSNGIQSAHNRIAAPRTISEMLDAPKPEMPQCNQQTLSKGEISEKGWTTSVCLQPKASP